MIIREVSISDAEKLSCLIRQVEASSDYMLWEDGERDWTQEKQINMIQQLNESGNSTILVAEDDKSDLAGYLLAMGGSAKRNSHSAYLVVGISENCRGQGIGTALFNELERWAVRHGIHRLELTVVTKNRSGLSLYTKMGFEIEGTKKHSLVINSEFVDEYYMSKLMGPVPRC